MGPWNLQSFEMFARLGPLGQSIVLRLAADGRWEEACDLIVAILGDPPMVVMNMLRLMAGGACEPN